MVEERKKDDGQIKTNHLDFHPVMVSSFDPTDSRSAISASDLNGPTPIYL
jgi:hypothetical protein